MRLIGRGCEHGCVFDGLDVNWREVGLGFGDGRGGQVTVSRPCRSTSSLALSSSC